MRITHEADYAVRIVYVLASAGKMLPAREISERSGVSQRFALKILRKLASGGLVASYKGSSGGYELSVEPRDVSLGAVIECIDGPLEINHCLSNDFDCTRVIDKTGCRFHQVFSEISKELREKLYAIKVSDFMQPTIIENGGDSHE